MKRRRLLLQLLVMFRYTSHINIYSVNLIVQVFLKQDEMIVFSLSKQADIFPWYKKEVEIKILTKSNAV